MDLVHNGGGLGLSPLFMFRGGGGGFQISWTKSIQMFVLPSLKNSKNPQVSSRFWFLLHFTSSLHFTSLHLTSLHFTSLHFTSLHFTSLHFTSLHFTSHHITCTNLLCTVLLNNDLMSLCLYLTESQTK